MKNQRPDALGDRLKTYERIETSQTFPPNTYLYVRIDGRSFSKFTKGLSRPYDERLSNLMKTTTAALVKEFNALIGYTQSDEISLIIENSYEKGCMFESKKQKLISTISSYATSVFVANLLTTIPEKNPTKTTNYPSFDCRIFPLGDVNEATNAILWRENDAIKNSISMSAHHYFSHKELQRVKSAEMIDMLKTKYDVIWEDYPKFFKSGTFYKRRVFVPEVMGIQIKRSMISELDITLRDFAHTDRVKFVTGVWSDLSEPVENNITDIENFNPAKQVYLP